MSDSQLLTSAQKRFLRALELDCDPTGPPVRVLGKLPPSRLAEWLANPAFEARLRQLLEMVAEKRRMTLQMASGRAADRLDASFDAPGYAAALSSEERRTCLELVKLVERRRGAGAGSTSGSASGESGAKVRQMRTAKSAESGVGQENSSGTDLVHRDVGPEEAQELTEQLGGRK